MSEPVKVLPMAQLLRLAREKEERERQEGAQADQSIDSPPEDKAQGAALVDTSGPLTSDVEDSGSGKEVTSARETTETHKTLDAKEESAALSSANQSNTSLPPTAAAFPRKRNQSGLKQPSYQGVNVEDKDPRWQAFVTRYTRLRTIKPGETMRLLKFIFDRTTARGVDTFITSTGEILKVCEFKHRTNVFPRLNFLSEKGFIEKKSTGSNKKNEGLLIRFDPDGPIKIDAAPPENKTTAVKSTR
jgi:hypothetical protein